MVIGTCNADIYGGDTCVCTIRHLESERVGIRVARSRIEINDSSDLYRVGVGGVEPKLAQTVSSRNDVCKGSGCDVSIGSRQL